MEKKIFNEKNCYSGFFFPEVEKQVQKFPRRTKIVDFCKKIQKTGSTSTYTFQ